MSATQQHKQPTIPLGGTASSIHVSRVSLGLMGMTWCDPSQFTPDEEAFATIRQAIASGVSLLDAGEFYGPQSDAHANLKLVRRYFQKYPEDRSKVVLCVKGGCKIFGPGSFSEKGMAGMGSLTDADSLREVIQQARQTLASDDKETGKDIDLWEPARFPAGVDVADIIKVYIQLRDEGLFKHLSLSEVKGDTIEKAVQASNNGIASVEVEYSPFMREAEDLGVLAVCEKYKIPILAYSPVGKGLLSGELRSRSDLPQGDLRLWQDAFSEENFSHNIQLADEFNRLAKGKGCTSSQLVLAWILTRSPVLTVIPGTRKAARAKENAESTAIKLNDEDLQSIEKVLATFTHKGGRYSEAARAHQNLWA